MDALFSLMIGRVVMHNFDKDSSRNKPGSSPADGKSSPETDPNVQVKFTLIFGILAFIPLVLFYYFGISHKESSTTTGGTTAGAIGDLPNIGFQDITTKSGIDFQRINGATGEKLLPETMGGGCAFFDYDNDGDPDLLFVNGKEWPWSASSQSSTNTNSLVLYRNDGKGNFENATANSGLESSLYGMGTAIGDFDNDGLSDVFITALGQNKLFRNLGDGRFRDVTTQTGVANATNEWSTSATWIDYNRDGHLDLFVCRYVQWNREMDLQLDYRLPNIGRAYGPPMNFPGTFPLLYQNNGKGGFTDVSETAGIKITNKATGLPLAKSLGVAPVDIDHDGWIDLVVANDTVQNFVFRNNQNGTFSEQGTKSGVAFDRFGSTRGAMGIDTATLLKNNSLAISIGNFANEMTALYVQQDRLFFTDQAIDQGIGNASSPFLTFGVFFFDVDLNGYPDLLTVNGHIEPEINKLHSTQRYEQPSQLFWNSGASRKERGFQLMPAKRAGEDLYKPIAGRGSAFADIDGDGDLDVVIVQLTGAPMLLRNEQDLNHSWVRLKLIGTGVNRDAIGAKVQFQTAGKIGETQVMPTKGYLSSSESILTIGLGKAKSVGDFSIEWPDGAKQTVSGLKLNQLNTIRQNQ